MIVREESVFVRYLFRNEKVKRRGIFNGETLNGQKLQLSYVFFVLSLYKFVDDDDDI